MNSTPAPSPAPPSAEAPRSTHRNAWEVLRAVASDIKLAHSVFALPFAVLGACIARPADSPWPRFAGQLALVVVCMVLARTWAMVMNRIADRDIDARNPRTARRAFASGRLKLRSGITVLIACNTLFVGACAGFWALFDNPWPLYLSEVVLIWIAFYSFTKRFTWLCHIFLGGALAASPLAAAIAINPAALSATPTLWYLAAMVVCWVAGFDIIYALQDVDIDRAEKLWSIPSRFGINAALWISRVLHAVAAAMLILAWRAEPRLGPLFASAVALVAILLAIEHAVLARRGKAGLDLAFFTINGIVSCVLGVAGCADLLL